ncbi:hypothetical protein F2Q70_00021180 [Brassica cretica]|uniref:t-SNARE coiled-coil homology domain-containing protein n=1 Tax=Brassica cretica TaxID=69181 RepID=A0A8S9GSM9_BRACR|nr:hypothetical protein F2Q70_00021180 [Brassica cretica]
MVFMEMATSSSSYCISSSAEFIDAGEKTELECLALVEERCFETISACPFAKDPALYGIDQAELERRRRWTSNARTQVRNVKTGVLAGKGNAGVGNASEVRLELMRMPNSNEANRYDQYGGRDDDGFVQSESDRQMLLIKQQDEELDELSKSVERIGGVGLTIHDELVAQERIIDELGTEMDSTKNRLDFVQKKVGMVMKKAGAKGQMMMICFLLVLFIILFVLVFLT